MPSSPLPTYSIVIALKNEADNIEALVRELVPVMEGLKKPWELICIDDGSTDNTGAILQKLSLPNLVLIAFDKNYGQSSGFDAGFKAAKGSFIITLDGDGQNDPHDIPRLLEMMEGADLVCGIRSKRKDTFSKRLTSKIANTVRRWLCDDTIQDSGCSLKVYRKERLSHIKMYNGMHRFLPALFLIEGFRVKQCSVNHRERWKGKSNYNFFNRSFNTLFDLLAVWWMKKRHLHYRIKSHG